MLTSGMELADVSRRLGHSNQLTTARIYARFLPENEDTATTAFEAYLRSNA